MGFTDEDLARIRSRSGWTSAGGRPQEIALSIAAGLVAARHETRRRMARPDERVDRSTSGRTARTGRPTAPAYQERERVAAEPMGPAGLGRLGHPRGRGATRSATCAGLDALEFGCGACQFGIKVAMRGARVTGLDFSAAQLRHGRTSMAETGVRFPVVQADGERIPFRDESFDLVFCDHGVMGFADPFRTVPEVARVLRPGGVFVFNGTTPWIWVAWGDDEDRRRPARCGRTTSGCGAPSRTSRPVAHDRVPAARTATGSGCSARTASRSRT